MQAASARWIAGALALTSAVWLVALAGLLALANRVHDDVPVLLAVKLPLLQSRPELIFALCLPNVPQLFGYREYRHAQEKAGLLRWRPDAAWALLTALALAISLFGMWQRLEFLYFQF